MYVIFEGVDGVGKSSLAVECAARLRGKGLSVRVLSEPFFPRSMLGRVRRYSFLEQAMIFERYRVRAYERRVAPWLRKGGSVVQVRSWMSTAVYQYYRGGYLDQLPSYISFSLDLMPAPALFIVLDIDYPTALARKSDLEWDAATYDMLRSGYYWVSSHLTRKNLHILTIQSNRDFDSVMSRVFSFLESF